ncbi:DUF3800 domain-containing protein [Legionella pneumophila]
MDIFIDESGNPELGIRDNSQLFFTLGSHNAEKVICSQAINKAYNTNKPKEIKFLNLKRTTKGISKIKSVFKFLLDKERQMRTFTIYKPFYMFNSFITLCQDEILEQQKINTGDENFIKYRRNFVWFYTLFTIGPTFLRHLINAYQNFIFQKDQSSLTQLTDYISLNINDPLNIYGKINEHLIKQGASLIDSISETHVDDNKELFWLKELSWLDLTLSSTRYLIKFWGENYDNSFNIYHDESIPLEKRSGFFNIMSEVDNCSINSFQFVDSKNCIEIQVADIIAGTFNYWYKIILLKRLGMHDKEIEEIFKEIDQIIMLTPNEWHLHLIPDIECMTNKQRSIIETYKPINQYVEPFCFETFSKSKPST